MAYDFLGTFNQAQFDRYSEFARNQLELVDLRIKHLEAEMIRIGVVVFRYDEGIPQALTADPETSYMAKLLAAYEVQGGHPFYDLRTRSRSNPIFLQRGDEVTSPHTMSNGEAIGGKGLADGPSAELVRRSREWLDETLQSRFGRLERKIRRALDYRDQLELEVSQLKVLQSELTTANSLEDLLARIQQLIDDPSYRALTTDTDPFGLLVNALYSSYDVPSSRDPNAPSRQASAVVPQRQQGVIVKPGQSTT